MGHAIGQVLSLGVGVALSPVPIIAVVLMLGTPRARVNGYSFDAAGAPTQKETQYYEMLGTRGIWHMGWKAVTEHGPVPIDLGKFDQDRWQLFHTDVDRSEARDLAEEHPEGRGAQGAVARRGREVRRPAPQRPRDLRVPCARVHDRRAEERPVHLLPGTSEVPEASAAQTTNASHKILAEVELTADSQGVIVAQGSRFGGFSLFVKDGKLNYVYNFLGIPPEQRIVADAPTSGTHVIGVEFVKEGTGEHHEPTGPVRLYVDDELVAQDRIRTIASRYSLCGEGLCIGYDGGDAVSAEYTPRFEFTGGKIVKVVVDVADDAYVDVERQMVAAMARD